MSGSAKQLSDDIVSKLTIAFFNNQTVSSLKSKHIFFFLKDQFIKTLNVSEYVEMLYQHILDEKCLSLLRVRNIHMAETVFNNITIPGNSFSPTVVNGMKVLYYSVSAYREYTMGKYVEALATIDKSIKYAKAQGRLTAEFFLQSITNLRVNKIRILARMNEITQVESETVELLRFLLLPIIDENEIIFETVDIDNYFFRTFGFVISVVDPMIRHWSHHGGSSHSEIYSNIAKRVIWNHIRAPKNRIDLFSLLVCRDDNQASLFFLKLLVENIDNVLLSPLIIRKIILEKFVNECENNDIPLSCHEKFSVFKNILNKCDVCI